MQAAMKTKSEVCQSAFASLVIFIVFASICWPPENEKAKCLEVMREEFVEIYYYVNIFIITNGFLTVYYTIAMRCINGNNYKNITYFNLILFLVRVAITSYGIHFVWSQRYDNLLEEFEQGIGTG